MIGCGPTHLSGAAFRGRNDWAGPIDPAFAGQQAGVELEQSLADADLLARRWVLADDVQEETHGGPGSADPQHIILRSQRGFRWAVQTGVGLADPQESARCDDGL